MFKDPIKATPKTHMAKDVQRDHMNSVYVNMGTDYGVGYTNPIGGFGKPKQNVDTLPRTDRSYHEKNQ